MSSRNLLDIKDLFAGPCNLLAKIQRISSYLVEFSPSRLYGDDGADRAALDEELFDDVVLDPLDGQADVDVFGEGPAKQRVCSILLQMNVGDVSVCMFACV